MSKLGKIKARILNQGKSGKWIIPKSRKKTEEYDKPSQLQFRTPMGGCRQVEYETPGILMDLIDNLDAILDQFLKEVDPDEFNNGSFLDEYIDHIMELAKKDLKQQSIEHGHVIESIKQIERGNLLSYTTQYNELQKALSDNLPMDEKSRIQSEEEKRDEKESKIHERNIG